ncbi:hypothetical protein RBSWK_01492 [Rhodopirellula baltica SWK14]|uniref:Uncharacterized protein n=1 Tax=Rhodopirellula baltica SWK14 TaxID=993516 RepID=L7CKU3_RHOBT|nr:hypothetical protein RBSWK_01492 [Rhodopirellula baltica SWK14]
MIVPKQRGFAVNRAVCPSSTLQKWKMDFHPKSSNAVVRGIFHISEFSFGLTFA